MNERERWIVYPLLFFALGAALRDKFFQTVSADELKCKQLLCEEVVVVDPAKPNRVVAKLTSSSRAGAQAGADGFGMLVLIDSEGNELCGVTNQALSVREIQCLSLAVVDPDRPARALAKLMSAVMPSANPADLPRRFGLLVLNNQEYGRLFGVPPVNRPALPGAAAPGASGAGEETSPATEASKDPSAA
jgi:hypothetical protein